MTQNPLVDRVGHVAGVESVVDGTGEMAAFAAAHMAQLTAELDRLHVEHEWEGIDEALAKDDTGRVRRRLLDHFASRLPGNWATVFAPLFHGGKQVPSKE
jgi:hypothetical protein